jgi:hypothetical protein
MSRMVSIHLVTREGKVNIFKLAVDATLEEWMDDMKKLLNRTDTQRTTFMYNGSSIKPQDTPVSLGMSHHKKIYVDLIIS